MSSVGNANFCFNFSGTKICVIKSKVESKKGRMPTFPLFLLEQTKSQTEGECAVTNFSSRIKVMIMMSPGKKNFSHYSFTVVVEKRKTFFAVTFNIAILEMERPSVCPLKPFDLPFG